MLESLRRAVTRSSCIIGCVGGAAIVSSCRKPASEAPSTVRSAMPNAMVSAAPRTPSAQPGVTFEEDVRFLTEHGPLKVLVSPSGGQVAVSSQYQGRVMTSATEKGGRSLGFINRGFIREGKVGTPFDNYGGEDRFWLGPEGGQYGLYFAPKKPFTFDNWQTPHRLQEGPWQIRRETPTSIAYAHAMTVSNYSQREFSVEIEREISVQSVEQAREQLGVAIPEGVRWVGFTSTNTLKNAGKDAWNEATGLLSVWILGMFAPVPGTRVIVPFDPHGPGEIVNDRYFGKVPAERLLVEEQRYLLFKCDGKYRSKIGLRPERAKAALGSYSEPAQLLTLVMYTKPSGATRYVNSMWELQQDPYGGDVINSYNDGPPAPDKPPLGGFYEMESSSPAAALGPGATLTHVHHTYHFSGPRESLEALSRHVLGVSLAALPPNTP